MGIPRIRMETPELDRVVPGIRHLAFENDDAVDADVSAVALDLLAAVGIHATCDRDDDDTLTIEVKGVIFTEEVSRFEPLPAIVACVNAVLKARAYPSRWIQFHEPHWSAGELGVVLVNETQLEALAETDLLYGYLYDPSDPND